jgi:hypothetical protein
MARALDPTLTVAEYIARTNPGTGLTDTDMHKLIKAYFLAHPTKNSTTIRDIVAYAVASAIFTPNSSEIDSQNESSNALTSSSTTSEANETNNLEKSSVESKLLNPLPTAKTSSPPQFGERMLLLVLSKDERVNIPGDLAEEYIEIREVHGVRFAKIWYYKQVVASAWPLFWKALKWGVWAYVGTWIRRYI